ncbi:hypothetical protein C7974DRAFT_357014 [Boeremia exigua]|uniref:uncharacterized protein n=1 Tax=Boeremia exigua TaxID=749465 RepID=UPI001E8E6590|nr:uncharacterized protein C7974DRAFT_357014 [Boeremia exigua]KAH6632923.1 hypothetical protein C7974DRAFT_357014 [Boeremia exigua]
MLLLDLPLELLHEILGWSILIRGIKRGLRLRLVNKMFAREVLVTLPLFKTLDPYPQPSKVSGDTSILPITTTYLERRVLNERQGGSAVLLRIRSVAAQLCQESVDGSDEQEYIKQLCPLVIETCRVHLDEIWSVDQNVCKRKGAIYSNDLASDVYLAALYTNTWPVVTRWARSGRSLLQRSLIFGDARNHAARFGSTQVLAAMIESRHEDTFQMMRSYFLMRTAEAGRMEIVRFVFNFKATQHPWAFARKRSRPIYPFFNEQGLAMLNTPSKEVFDFITEKRRIHCTTRTYGVKENTNFLLHCARKGWADMAAQYLALGALVDGPESGSIDENQRPLLLACKYGHEDVVRVLLANGASTTAPALETAVKHGQFTIAYLLLDQGAEVGRAVAEAVAKGYRVMVHTLLERRTDARAGLQGLLVRAFELEDEALFQLLVQHSGGVVEEITRSECARVAKERGLESMSKTL